MKLFIAISAFTIVLLHSPWAVSQEQTNQAQGEKTSSQQTQNNEKPVETKVPDVHILYTGRLLGYFREPDWQSPDKRTCPTVKAKNGSSGEPDESPSARTFDEIIGNQYSTSILVGTGDNFAPELEAREFCLPPLSATSDAQLGKDLFAWNGGQWELGFNHANPNAYVHGDNVANFLINRGYTAVVPGRHDFYFGPDRLRLLARLLATPQLSGKAVPASVRRPKSVQMLGANIVIETSWKSDHEPLPDTARPPAFVPRFPRGSDLLTASEYDFTLTGLKDGDIVYPWFVGVKVSLKHLPDDLMRHVQKKEKPETEIAPQAQQNILSQLLEKSQPRLCLVPPVLSDADFDNPANKDEERALFDPGKCRPLRFVKETATDNQSTDNKTDQSKNKQSTDKKSNQSDELSYALDFPWYDAARNNTLLAGERYRLCFSGPPASISKRDDNYLSRNNIRLDTSLNGTTTITPSSTHKNAGDTYFCVRFSTYMPLFQSSWGRQTNNNLKDCKKQADDPADCKEQGKDLEDCQDDRSLRNNNKPTLRNPMAMCPIGPDNQQDPMPYVLVEPENPNTAKDEDKNTVAIFGVVDPHLADSIGLLNMAWRNIDSHFKTQVSFKDPGEAIKQLLASFKRRYKEDHGSSDFAGIMVLLAQMGPPQAQAFSNRMPDFTVVISAADQNAANLETVSNVWTPKALENGSSYESNQEKTTPLPAPHPKYLAVPYPHYVGAQNPSGSQWITDIGSLKIYMPQKHDPSWRSESEHLRKPTSIGAIPLQQEQWFSQVLFPTVVDRCISEGQMQASVNTSADDAKRQDQRLSYLQVMTLCAMQKETNADVAMLQQRDIFTDLPNYVDQLPLEQRSSQEILDRIIWKGDFLQLIYVPGSTLKKVLDQSKAFDAEDKSSLSLADETNRGLITLGIPFDPDRKEYKINGAALNPNKLYAVATSEFIAMGDTGYPDLASSQANPPLLPMEAGRNGKFKTISSVVCNYLSPHQNCLPEIDGKDYFDLSKSFPDNPRIGETSWQELKLWSVFSHPANVLGSPAIPAPGVKDVAETTVRNRPFWDFNLSKWSLGLTRLAHTGNNFDVKTLFGGLTSSEPSTVSSTTWTSDFAAAFSRSWAHHLFSISPGYTYNVQHKGQPDDLDQVTQTANRGSLDAAYAYIVEGRQPEHQDIVFTAHFETPLVTAFNSVTLNSTHPGEDGKPIKDQLRFHLDRSYTVLMRPGYRWKRHVSSVEFGPEWGHEWKALTGIDFLTGANTPLICSASSGTPLSSCTANALKANPNAILGTSIVATNRNNQDHTGAYWKINMTVPFTRRISYVLTDTGDYFPVRYATENSTTTLLRDYSQHQLKIDIFSSISIGPEFDALLYRNKAVPGLNGHFLFQDQILMKAQWSFDLFNWRDKRKQVEYGPPASK